MPDAATCAFFLYSIPRVKCKGTIIQSSRRGAFFQMLLT
jgi:hypothetical protein